jgi:hypothetical protein
MLNTPHPHTRLAQATTTPPRGWRAPRSRPPTSSAAPCSSSRCAALCRASLAPPPARPPTQASLLLPSGLPPCTQQGKPQRLAIWSSVLLTEWPLALFPGPSSQGESTCVVPSPPKRCRECRRHRHHRRGVAPRHPDRRRHHDHPGHDWCGGSRRAAGSCVCAQPGSHHAMTALGALTLLARSLQLLQAAQELCPPSVQRCPTSSAGQVSARPAPPLPSPLAPRREVWRPVCFHPPGAGGGRVHRHVLAHCGRG